VDGTRLSIDVVILAYGRYDLTESCLRHLQAQTREHRVILVDNGSTDGTSELVARDFPDVHVVTLAQNMPFAVATNRGVSEGDGDVVVLLNNDVDCEPAFLERLVAPLDRDPRAGSATALLIRPDRERIDSVGLTCDATLAAFPRLQGHPVGEATDGSTVLVGPAGAGAAYRRSAWAQIGGLDETIFAYMEDFDLAMRLRIAGWGAALATDAVAVHVGSATHGHRSAWQRRHGGFGRGYVLRRYGILRSRAGLRALVTEAIVVAGDLVISRDLNALRGRLEGWRAAAPRQRLPTPPSAAVDHTITFRESLALRRGVYERRAA